MDATDVQFQSFIKGAGVPVDDQGIVEWSFDDRCGIINHALKYGLKLSFAEQNQFGNNSQSNKNNSGNELLTHVKPAPQAWIDALDAYPFEPVSTSAGRDYPNLEEGE